MSAKLMGAALETDMPSQTAKLVLLKLTDAAEADGTRIYPSIATMARVADCSVRHAHRMVNLFREVGLLILVHAGGKGPGDPNEYRLNVELFDRLTRDGWKKTFPRVRKSRTGDEADEAPMDDSMESPLEAEKGDTMSPIAKGDIGAPKGDMGAAKGDSMESYNPSLDPPNRPIERDARAQEGEGGTSGQDGKIPDAELLAKLRSIAVGVAHDSVAETEAAWRRLTREERHAAVERYPEWLAAKGARKAIAGLPAYLGERRWMHLPSKVAGGATAPSDWAPPWSRRWWWLYHDFVRRCPKPVAEGAQQMLRDKISLAKNRVGWKLPAAIDGPALDERASAELRQIPAEGNEAKAFAAAYAALGAPWATPDVVGWIFAPISGPPQIAEDAGDVVMAMGVGR